MNNYEYHIIHVDLSQPIIVDIQNNPVYLICWFKKLPISHLWLSEGIENHQQLLLKISNSIIQSLKHYVENKEVQFIQDLIVQGKVEEFYNILDKLYNINIRSAYLNPTLSIVICTRNRTSFLIQCINALLESDDNNFEIIVVDNDPSDDSTQKAVANFEKVIYIVEPKKGLDNARNTGAKAASNNIVAFTDDDVKVTANWTKELKKCFYDPQTMAVTGQILPLSITSKAQYIFEKYWSFNKGYFPVVYDGEYFKNNSAYGAPVWDIGAGANMAFRKKVFDLVGYFDDRLDVGASGCSGDSEFWYKILADGWECHYFPSLVVFHNHRNEMKSLKSQLFHYMKGQVSSLYVQFEKYGHIGNLRRIKKALPWYYLYRFKDKILGVESDKNITLFNEIKGCFSGALFYKKNKRTKDYNSPYPLHLNEAAVVNENTFVSVIITCYNYAHYLAQCIQSVVNQTYKQVEIIVVNDGSTDGTLELLKKYPTVITITTNRVGLSEARNIGVKQAKGSYVLFLDADDYLLNTCIEQNLYFFNYYPKAVFVVGDHERIDSEGASLPVRLMEEKEGFVYISLLNGNFIGMEAAVLYRRELFYCYTFDTTLRACEDYDLNLAISRYFPSVSHTHKVAVYRIHQKSMSSNNELMLKMVNRVLDKNKQLLVSNEEIRAFESGLINWKKLYSND